MDESVDDDDASALRARRLELVSRDQQAAEHVASFLGL